MDESQKASNFEEIFMQNTLEFANSLKDLKSLREQLYSAADHFESSFDRDDQKQFLVETSKDYITKALVNTVDHLGSVADKLNGFFDQKANEFSDTSVRFSCIQQRLNTFQEFVDLRRISKESITTMEAPKYHKKYTLPGIEENFQVGKTKFLYRNCISSPEHEMHHAKQDATYSKAFQSNAFKQYPPINRKGNSRINSSESSPHPDFSFTRVVPKKETGKRSASPLGFPLKRLGSVANRSSSPTPSDNRQKIPSESRRAASASRRPQTSRETDIESYTKKSKHMFKAFLNMNRPRKEV